MSALNLRNVKRDFSQLNFRPDIRHPNLINELKIILDAIGLRQKYDTFLSDINTNLLINIIKHICEVCYSNSHNTEVANYFITFLAKIYVEHCVDDTVKRSVTKCIISCPGKWQPELFTAISHHFISIMDNKYDLGEIEFLLKTLNECCDKFPDVVFKCRKNVTVFLELHLQNSYDLLVCESSPTEKISAMRCIHEAFRFFLTAVNKDISSKIISPTLNECFMDLLDSDHLPMETLFNCCLTIVHLSKKNRSAVECWKLSLDQLSIRSDLIKLGFCLAILSIFTGNELKIIDPDSEKTICTNLYNIIMDTSTRNMNDTSILLSSSRVFFVLSKQLCANSEIDIEKHQLECLITFLWVRMDHYLDGVRHIARDTMTNIIKMKDEYLLNQILERLSICDNNSKAFYIVLTILSDKVDSGIIIKYLPNIAERLLNLMKINKSAITIFIHLMVNHYTTTECKSWFNYWLCPLLRNTDYLDIKHLEQVITKAIEITPDVSEYINDLSSQNELSLKLYLICMNITKNVYFKNNNDGNWMSQSNFETLKKALHNNDENIRFIAVNLILDCKKKTQPFIDKELELMKYFIIYNNKYEKTSIKQKHLSFVKKMLMRIKESQCSVTVRNNESLNTSIIKNYTEFQHWFTNFCYENLFPDANFFRRNFFLESLRLIQTCLSPTYNIGLDESIKVSVLINCLWDTYEQNKILAKDILTYKNQESMKLNDLNLMTKCMLQTSEMLISGISPLNSITAGYLLEVVLFFNQNTNSEEYTYTILSNLMINLNKEVKLAEESLTLASARGPMYGTIHTIRHLLNTLNWQALSLNNKWTVFIENISAICLKCEKIVSIVVNDSSPEGIIPMDDLYRDDCQVTSQMVLLCCWRTTKESSLLLGDIVSIIEAQESEFSNNLITEICSCLTLLLSETKHRGAFEQISVAYLKICSVMWKSPTLHKIPLKYLEDVLTEIKTGLGETFCITRRSAGMPFIIQALLCTNHDNRKIVNYTMETLINICEDKNIIENLKVGVVHALNVLRTLFRCSQLGDLVGPFVSRAISISVIFFNSSSWPVRNSSTLLLSTLVNRIFGVPRSSTEISWENCMSGQVFFRKYPELYDTFLNEFKKFSPMDMRPSLYPTLLLVGRLYPSVNEEKDCAFPLSVYIPYVFKCAQSPVMKTRMLAATSIAPQVTTHKFVEHLYITYNELTNKNLKENTVHGLLLQMFSLVEHLRKLEIDDLNKLVFLTQNLLTKYDKFANYSYVVQEVYLRCITYLWIQLDGLQYNYIELFYKSIWKNLINLILSNAIGQSKYLESAILFLFSICIKAQTDFSIVLYTIMKSGIQCRIMFEILNIILSEKQIINNNIYVHLNKFENILNWDCRTLLKNQLMDNESFIKLLCHKCTIIDSLIDIKYLVLSIYPKALYKYFSIYESIDSFISKVLNLRRDTEISRALLCINGHLFTLESLEQPVIIQLTQLFENIYYARRCDECKIACIDIIVDNYNLLINKNKIMKTFLKLWTIIVHYSEDNSENVRKKVWRLMKKDTNCAKSFELLFDEFGIYFDEHPSAVLVALICWSYLDFQLSQDHIDGQVFDSYDTSEYKEFTFRQRLIQNKIIYLTKRNPLSLNLEISHDLQEWIVEDWSSDFDVKPNDQDLKTVGNFMIYAKEFYSRNTELIQNTFVFKINE